MQVYIGRPECCEGRLEKEIKVYDFLDKIGVEYYRVDHESAHTAEQCKTVDVALNTVTCKNLFLCNRQKTSFYLLMMPASKEFRTKNLSPQLNSSRLSFGEVEDLQRLLNLTPGSVSIMGLINDKDGAVQLVIDRDVLVPEHISCHPAINTSSIKLKTKDVLEKYLPATRHEPILVEL